jgi:hypothetical protein
LKACRVKENKHKRAACEAAARKHYGPLHKAKKAASARKASRAHRSADGRGGR